MTIPHISRANLTLSAVAQLRWKHRARQHTEDPDVLRQTAHLVTVLGYSSEYGSIYVSECQASRDDSQRYCALFADCQHDTTDSDYDQYDDMDWAACSDGGRHTMFNGDAYGKLGWHKDTRQCRFLDFFDLTALFDELNLARGVWILELLHEDWEAGEVVFKPVATIGEPVGPYGDDITIRTESGGRLNFGVESDVRALLVDELEEMGTADYDPEHNAITIDVDTLAAAIAAYITGETPRVRVRMPVIETPRRRNGIIAPPPRRTVTTVDTGGLT